MPSTTPRVTLLNVQVLRAYGALAVAYYHTGYVIGVARPIGSFGVAIFFVISGFIMAMLCDTNPQHFLSRRIARIVPLYWLLTLAVTALAVVAPNLLGSTSVNSFALLKSLFFIPYRTRDAFFPVLFLGWSLNYEMYFYLLIAVALFLHKRAAAFLAGVAMCAVFFLIRALHFTGAVTFYAQPIVFEFVAGLFCYYVFRSSPVRSIRAIRWPLVFAVLAAALCMIAASAYANGTTALSLVGLASTVLVLSSVLLDKINFSLRWPFLLLLGDASYVIYLMHPYCQQFINKLATRPFPFLVTTSTVGMLFAMLVTIFASLLSHSGRPSSPILPQITFLSIAAHRSQHRRSVSERAT
jgi:peptidoglycan/LPS O-acetylase OafA/YrhL